MAFTFDPMKIKLGDLRSIEKSFGVKMMSFIKKIERQGGMDIEALEINELQAMVFVALAASGKRPTAEQIDEMDLGEMMNMLSEMDMESEPANPTTS